MLKKERKTGLEDQYYSMIVAYRYVIDVFEMICNVVLKNSCFSNKLNIFDEQVHKSNIIQIIYNTSKQPSGEK